MDKDIRVYFYNWVLYSNTKEHTIKVPKNVSESHTMSDHWKKIETKIRYNMFLFKWSSKT